MLSTWKSRKGNRPASASTVWKQSKLQFLPPGGIAKPSPAIMPSSSTTTITNILPAGSLEPGETFTCNDCSRTFHSKRSLKKHVFKKHIHDKANKKSRRKCSPMKTTKRTQYFREAWSKDFAWARKSNFGRAWVLCVYCNRDLQCGQDGVTALKRHSKSLGHINNLNAVKFQKSQCKDMLKCHQNITSLTRRVKKLEIQIAAFIATHNLPFLLSDDLVMFLKNIDIDEKVQKELKCGHTKCTAIVCNVTGKFIFDNLVQTLRTRKFSLMIDESTDVSSSKHLSLVVRYNKDDFTVCDQFLALIEVHDASSNGLHKSLVDFFVEHEIPYRDNLVGFAADGASVMFGTNNSVAQKLKAEIPHLFIFKCICHSLALAVSYASKILPPHLGTLLSDVYSYFKFSSKRRDGLEKFQAIFELPEHKILKLMKVRWLSLSAVVSRFLEQYPALFEFFDEERRSNRVKKAQEEAERIHKILRNHFNLLYLQFLNYILPLVCKRNLEFQSETPKIHELHRQMETLFKTITSHYLKEDYVARMDPELIEFVEQNDENKHNWELLCNVDIGPLAAADLACLPSSTPANDVNHFRSTCRSFLIELARQIQERFPFNNQNVRMMKKLEFINPENLIKIKNISEVAVFFGCDVEKIHAEYRELRFKYSKDYIADIPLFWKKVRSCMINGMEEFPLVNDLVQRVIILPHSSAAVERIFSAINLNKTKIRNKLNVSRLTGILHTKKLGRGKSIFDLNMKDYSAMIKLMNTDMYS